MTQHICHLICPKIKAHFENIGNTGKGAWDHFVSIDSRFTVSVPKMYFGKSRLLLNCWISSLHYMSLSELFRGIFTINVCVSPDIYCYGILASATKKKSIFSQALAGQRKSKQSILKVKPARAALKHSSSVLYVIPQNQWRPGGAKVSPFPYMDLPELASPLRSPQHSAAASIVHHFHILSHRQWQIGGKKTANSKFIVSCVF